MSVPRKICPACKTANDAAARACRKCGALLNDFPTELVAVPDMVKVPAGDMAAPLDLAQIPADGIGIRVPGAPKAYYLHIYKELIIGRPADATFDSVLDLSELGAYAMGVSRRHVMIRKSSTGFEVLDLDSRNGSWLNGERLVPNRSYPLSSGAELRLGKMLIQIVYHAAANERSKP